MTNVFLFAGKYLEEGEDIDLEEVQKMWDLRSKDFENCNISQSNFIYQICERAYESAISRHSLVNDEASHSALRKMAGIGLYLMQQQRDNGEIYYNNSQELLQLLQCQSSLKTFHPELFDRYAFTENIKALCKLQLQNELPSETVEAIKEAQDRISNKITERSFDVDVEHDDIELDQ